MTTVPTSLRFRSDGSFTILQFTDVHWHNGDDTDQRTRAVMELALDREQPDLAVFTGDTIDGGKCRNPQESLRQAVAAVERRAIPWALVFGNHDDEGTATRHDLQAALAEHPHCLAEAGPADLSGVGNYVLRVQGSSADALLYCLDSGSYAPKETGGYAWIQPDQIAWYTAQSRAFTAANGGQPLPSLAFFHIPLPEYSTMWESVPCHGTKLEAVCCPKVNSRFFDALVQMGDVMGTFAGHDHINDYCGELQGVQLCYGRATGYNTYGRDGFARGARVIRLIEGERRFATWLRLADGSVVTAPDGPAPR
jgi:3',5'-cyclic AMP phosphodiesterase CpdA